MAYYAPFYRPTYYDPVQPNPMGQFNQQIQPPPASPTSQQGNNGLIWVQGEAGAKSFIVAPGNTVMLMDSEGERFYLKSADSSGMPMPLRIFDYKERTETPSQAFSGSVTAQNVNLDNFVTRDEFERRMASMASQCKCKNDAKNKEDVNNGNEPTVQCS